MKHITDAIRTTRLEMLHWIFSLANLEKRSSPEAFVESKSFLFLTAYAEFLEQQISRKRIRDSELKGLMKTLKNSSRTLHHSVPGRNGYDLDSFHDAVSSFAVAYGDVYDYIIEHR